MDWSHLALTSFLCLHENTVIVVVVSAVLRKFILFSFNYKAKPSSCLIVEQAQEGENEMKIDHEYKTNK